MRGAEVNGFHESGKTLLFEFTFRANFGNSGDHQKSLNASRIEKGEIIVFWTNDLPRSAGFAPICAR